MAELTGKAISELPAATTIGDSDLLALSQNGASKKVTPPVLLSVVESEISGLNSSIATYVRPNLLDNWYFVRGSGSVGAYGSFPVNQRGQASYSAAGFTIDRLQKMSGKGTVYTTAQGLQFSTSDSDYAYFTFYGQDVPSWMTATYSILTNLGITTVRTGGSIVTLPSGILVYINSGGRLTLRIPGNLSQSNSETFIAAKVEIGSTQTLAHQVGNTWVLNEIPDYGEELAKCQRYYIICGGFFLGYGYNASTFMASISLPVTMVKAPTVSASGTGYFIQDYGHIIESVSNTSGLFNNGVRISGRATVDVNKMGFVSGLTITLSAEL